LMSTGDIEAELTPVNRRLHDAAFRRSPGEQDPLDLEIAENQLEWSVVERGVARLDDEAVACLWRDRSDELPTEACFGRLPDEPGRVAVPDAAVVIRIEDGKLAGARVLEDGHNRRVSRAE
jgi:hypothetical protein